jgi:hypothetical protein
MANQTTPFIPVQSEPRVVKKLVKAGSTAPEAGQWLVQNTGGDAEYAVLPSDGASTSQIWVGVVAQIVKAVTATVDGIYLVYDAAGNSFKGPVTTSSNLATSLLQTKVTLDVSSNDQTIDENDTTNGVLYIEEVDLNGNTVIVKVDPDNVSSAG